MVAEREGVIKLFPEPRVVPPVEAAYQLMVPADAVACKVTDPASQREAGVVPVIAGIGLIVATTAVLSEVQEPEVTST